MLRYFYQHRFSFPFGKYAQDRNLVFQQQSFYRANRSRIASVSLGESGIVVQVWVNRISTNSCVVLVLNRIQSQTWYPSSTNLSTMGCELLPRPNLYLSIGNADSSAW